MAFDSVKELYHYRAMVKNFIIRDLRGRYKGSILGFLWNFIIPIVQIAVYILVFTAVFNKTGTEAYPVYITIGMVPWIFFSDSVSSSSGTIVANSSLVTKIYFPRAVIPISNVISKCVNYIIMTVVALLIILLTGYGIKVELLLLVPVGMILLLVFCIGFSLILSALNAYLRDVEYITSVVMIVLIWLTPIMYEKQFADGNPLLSTIIALNPMSYYVEFFHSILYYQVFPSSSISLPCILISLGFIVGGWMIFHKLERDFAEVL